MMDATLRRLDQRAEQLLVGNEIGSSQPDTLPRASEEALGALRLGEILKEAGLPDGVVNVVHGDKEAVDALLDHTDVKAVSFVGSTPIARYVYERGVAAGKRVQALGGASDLRSTARRPSSQIAGQPSVAAASMGSCLQCSSPDVSPRSTCSVQNRCVATPLPS